MHKSQVTPQCSFFNAQVLQLIATKEQSENMVDALRLTQIKRKVVSLSRHPDTHFIEIGKYLEILGAINPSMLRETIAGAGLKQRKAYYLIETADRLKPFMRYQTRVEKIGWTKCQIIAAKMTRANARKLIEMAEANTVQELKLLIQEDEKRPKAHCVLLYLAPNDYDLFSQAMLHHGATKSARGLRDKEKALMRLIRKANF